MTRRGELERLAVALEVVERAGGHPLLDAVLDDVVLEAVRVERAALPLGRQHERVPDVIDACGV